MEERLHHTLDLSFVRGTESRHGLFHGLRAHLERLDARLCTREEDDAARLSHRGRGLHVLREKELLDHNAVRTMCGDEPLKLPMERDESWAERPHRGREDTVRHTAIQTAVRIQDAVAEASDAGIEAEDDHVDRVDSASPYC